MRKTLIVMAPATIAALADGSATASAKVPAQIGFWFFVLKDAIELHVARTLDPIAAHRRSRPGSARRSRLPGH